MWNRRRSAIRCVRGSWVSKSHDKLAAALREMGHKISAVSVKRLLPTLGYSRQTNRKADEGSKHPDRDAQFEHINARVVERQAAGQPVISVDTKKKELVGNYKNGGSDYRPKGDPQRVKVHDFEDKELGKVVPYGVYDVAANSGFVSVGINADTAEFAVAAVRRWFDQMGRERYPNAGELTITAGGGSNGSRVRSWKIELQKFADATGISSTSIPIRRARRSGTTPGLDPGGASIVLPHHADVARPTAHRQTGRRRTDRGDNNHDRTARRERTRYTHLREGHQSHRRRDGSSRHHRRRVPS